MQNFYKLQQANWKGCHLLLPSWKGHWMQFSGKIPTTKHRRRPEVFKGLLFSWDSETIMRSDVVFVWWPKGHVPLSSWLQPTRLSLSIRIECGREPRWDWCRLREGMRSWLWRNKLYSYKWWCRSHKWELQLTTLENLCSRNHKNRNTNHARGNGSSQKWHEKCCKVKCFGARDGDTWSRSSQALL